MKEFITNEIQKDLAEGTIRKYKSDLKTFKEFLVSKYNITEIDNIKEIELKKIINRYIEHLKREGFKPTTINGKIITVNKFIKYKGFKCSGKLISIQNKAYLNDVISLEEYKKLISVCDNKRDKIIIKTLANTGLRISELLSLTKNDIENNKITIYGKRGKNREVFIAPQLRNELKDYINNYREDTHKRLLFTGKRGALQRTSINRILLSYSKKANISKYKLHPHSLRHFYAKNLHNNGVGLDVIQTILGHENINTTTIYTKASEKEFKRIILNNYI